jgi:hypothetical protein
MPTHNSNISSLSISSVSSDNADNLYNGYNGDNYINSNMSSLSKTTKSSIKTISRKSEKKRATQKIIKNLFRKNINKARELNLICSDSNVCMAFGTKRKEIIDFFEGFTNFKYVQSPIKKIGNFSANGYVKEIKYSKYGFNSYAVLKSSLKKYSDNLAYEYIVGQFLNIKAKIFPCFIETYGLYYYINQGYWKNIKTKSFENKPIKPNELKNSLELEMNPYDYSKMCAKSKYSALLVEHLKDVKSLNFYLDNYDRDNKESRQNYVHFIVHKLLYVLYQIYMPLSQLIDVFTHYDLHSGNILLYVPKENHYIEYHYHTSNEIINFKSEYIVKIIDYGRSYYKYEDGKPNPNDIYNNLCKEPKCNDTDRTSSFVTAKTDEFLTPNSYSPPTATSSDMSEKKNKCGNNFGLDWLDPIQNKSNFFISSSLPNPTHDLKLMNEIFYSVFRQFKTYDDLDNHFELYAYAKLYKLITKKCKNIHNINGLGLKPNNISGLPDSINNVRDMEEDLRNIIKNDIKMQILNEHFTYHKKIKIGDMHIYSDGTPMSFTYV